MALEDKINPLLIQDINIMRDWWGTESIDFKIFEALDEMEVRCTQLFSAMIMSVEATIQGTDHANLEVKEDAYDRDRITSIALAGAHPAPAGVYG